MAFGNVYWLPGRSIEIFAPDQMYFDEFCDCLKSVVECLVALRHIFKSTFFLLKLFQNMSNIKIIL